MTDDPTSYISAIQDFRQARTQADLREVMSRFTGGSNELLSYEDVRKKLKLQGSSERGLQDIPLEAIVGSVGRYTDFTRDFLPRNKVSGQRWARVKAAATEQAGLPPIEVYQIGEAYFVKDGNHRVSVARQLGASHIQAYVTEIRTRVPLTPNIKPDDLILKAEYADFLEQTRIDELRPDAELSVTVPGQYQVLAEHIAVHRYFMGLDEKRDISYSEAVAHWYDTVYLPVVRVIRERGILQFFPGRTEADLYVFIAEHRAILEKELGWEIQSEAAATHLASQKSTKRNVVSRLGEILLDAMSLDRLMEPGPPPGQWRRDRLAPRQEDCLFCELLVPVNGEPNGWFALEQGLVVAQRERALLHGLHVVPSEAQKDSQDAREIQAEFQRRCEQAGVEGRLVLAVGEVVQQICNRARWTDLVITNLAYPPAPQPLARLSSGFRELVQRCPRPVLATPQISTPLNKALLAYDGSPKAEEALFIATYLAGQWKIPLVVVTVLDNDRANLEVMDRARGYLESHGVEATYVPENGPVAETVLKVGEENACDLLIMGGYGYTPVLEVVLGSVVDQVLRESHKPVLICR